MKLNWEKSEPGVYKAKYENYLAIIECAGRDCWIWSLFKGDSIHPGAIVTHGVGTAMEAKAMCEKLIKADELKKRERTKTMVHNLAILNCRWVPDGTGYICTKYNITGRIWEQVGPNSWFWIVNDNDYIFQAQGNVRSEKEAKKFCKKMMEQLYLMYTRSK